MSPELLKVVADGGVGVALIVVVLIFLGHITKSNASVRTMVDGFSDHLLKQADQYATLTRETAVALKGLENAVRELQDNLKR